MKVRELMTADPQTAERDTTLAEIATMMKDEDVGAIPVVEGGRVAGVVTDRDIVVRCIANGKDATECTAEDVMSTEIRSVDPESDVDEAAGIMADAQVRRLPVVKNGKLVGMLSLGDIAVKAGEEEEETTAETLEGVSQGVRNQGRQQQSNGGRESGRERESGRQQQSNGGRESGRERESGRQPQSNGGRESGRQQQSGGRGQQSSDQSSGRSDARGQARDDRNERSQRSERDDRDRKRDQKHNQGQKQKKGAQGISNRSASREQSQAKVAPRRAEAAGKRNNAGKRRAG